MLGHVTVTPRREPPHRGRVPTFCTPGGCSTPACVHEAPSRPETSPPGQGRASRAEGPDADKADPLPRPCRALRAEPPSLSQTLRISKELAGEPACSSQLARVLPPTHGPGVQSWVARGFALCPPGPWPARLFGNAAHRPPTPKTQFCAPAANHSPRRGFILQGKRFHFVYFSRM